MIGLFGQEIFDNATGSNQAVLFHQPIDLPVTREPIKVSASAANPANTALLAFAPAKPRRPSDKWLRSVLRGKIARQELALLSRAELFAVARHFDLDPGEAMGQTAMKELIGRIIETAADAGFPRYSRIA